MNHKSLPYYVIDRRRAIDIIMEAKSQSFLNIFMHKSYQTMKLFCRLTFVVYGMMETSS